MNILQEKLIDTHCHLDDSRYQNEFTQIIKEIEKEMFYVIVPATNIQSIKNVTQLAEKYSFIKPAMGIHPEECQDVKLKQIEQIFNDLRKRVHIIGEIGLDYYNVFCDKDKQRKFLEYQIEYAKENNMPVILHSREAFDDTIDIIKNIDYNRIIWHCFSYEINEAKKILDLGNYISFTGIITFKKADSVRKVVSYVPLDRICAETDGPYLTPHPFRGKLNRPIYVKYVIEKIAELKNKSFLEINSILNHNAQKFFL